MPKRLRLALLSLLLVGCSSVSVDSDYDPQTDFSTFRTWSWMHDGPAQGVDDLTDGRIRAAVEAALPIRGLRKADAGASPDLRVAYHARVEQRIEAVPAPATTIGYGWRAGYVAYDAQQLSTYDEGTLIIDLVGADSEDLVWRGTATAIVGDGGTPEEREERIREAVEKLLERYPPGK
jgi:ABC-type glycerol-3-phosphate transport system substrate-binding protein